MPARRTTKKKSTKKPSAKQLAARRKFAAAAKARSKAAKAKKRNKTIITKPKRVIVINKLKNGSTVRRKIRNGYVDLVVRGTAKKTPQGWLVGRKTIPQGRGIATISSGYYLDKATGMIFAKRARNPRNAIKTYMVNYGDSREFADGFYKVKGKTAKQAIAGAKRLFISDWNMSFPRLMDGAKKAKKTVFWIFSTDADKFRPRKNVAQGFYDSTGVFHPIRSSADYDPGTAGETGKKPVRTRSKKRKAAAKKAASTARHKAATKSRKKTTSRLASRSLFRSVPLKAGSKVQRARNISQGFYDASGVFHPIRSSADYDPATAGETGKKPRRTRSKKRKAAAKKASSTARHKAATKSRKKTTSRLASRALSRSVPLKAGSKVQRARNPRYEVVGVNAQGKEFDLAIHVDANKTKTLQWAKSHYPGYKKYQITLRDRQDYIGGMPKPKTRKRRNSAASDRREFAGRYTGDKDLYFPQGTPTGLSKLGKLVLIKTQSGSIVPVKGTVWLCRDTKGKLHLGSTTNAPLTDMPAGSLGEVKRLEYEESKPHLGHPNPTIWFHKMGEETGERPTLYSDGKGGLKFRGGRYRITSRGIEN